MRRIRAQTITLVLTATWCMACGADKPSGASTDLGPPDVLATGDASTRVTQSWVGVDDTGAGYVVWGLESSAANEGRVAHYLPASGWSAPGSLAPGDAPPDNALDSSFAVTSTGTLYHATPDATGMTLFAYDADGYRQLSTLPTTESGSAHLLLDAKGEAIVVWTHLDTTALASPQLYAAYHHLDDTWSPVLLVPHATALTRDIVDVRAGCDAQGNVVAMWTEDTDTGHYVMVADLTEAQGWTAPVMLSDAGTSAIALGATSTGYALAVWEGGFAEHPPGAGWDTSQTAFDSWTGPELTAVSNDALSLVAWVAPRDLVNRNLGSNDLLGANLDAQGWHSAGFPLLNANASVSVGIAHPTPTLAADGRGYVFTTAAFDNKILAFPHASGASSGPPLTLDSSPQVLADNPDWPQDASTTFGHPSVAANGAGDVIAAWIASQPLPDGSSQLRALVVTH